MTRAIAPIILALCLAGATAVGAQPPWPHHRHHHHWRHCFWRHHHRVRVCVWR